MAVRPADRTDLEQYEAGPGEVSVSKLQLVDDFRSEPTSASPGAARAELKAAVEEAAPPVDSDEFYSAHARVPGNPAYHRSVPFASVEDARNILLNQMITCEDVGMQGCLSLADQDALETVPYTIEELTAMRGEYMLIAIPALSMKDFREFVVRAGLEGLVQGYFTPQDADLPLTTLGWYAIRKSFASNKAPGTTAVRIPTQILAFELLYAALAAKKATGKCPFGGASATTVWMARHEWATVIIGRYSASVISEQPEQ